jgi:hypothetical protein
MRIPSGKIFIRVWPRGHIRDGEEKGRVFRP